MLLLTLIFEGIFMYGVVALLDEQHHAKVKALWEEFYQKFGVKGGYAVPVPHFSYHVADKYNLAKLEKVLRGVAKEIEPFTIKTNGLGIFTGKSPVLYIPIVRNSLLTQFHERLWEPVSATATGASAYYHPDNWRPHITLTHRDVDHDLLPKVIRLISEREFYWDMLIDNLAVLSGSEEPDDTVMMTVKLGTGEVMLSQPKS
jgi:2'-5' RNA ligase